MKNIFSFRGLVFNVCCLFLLLSFNAFAQVGIGTTNPNVNAKLDITSTVAEPGGLLLPRVALTGTANVAPLAAHVQGMTVYNTATTGNVTPGYYYNDGAQWVRIAAASVPSDDWTTTGNAGTTAGTNYLGTSDTEDLVIATNGAERIRILDNGQVSINEPAPVAGDRLTVQGAANEFAINGYTTTGTGVYGENSSGTGNGVYGWSANIGVRGYGGHGGVFQSGLDTGYGAIVRNITASGTNRTGLLAIGQDLGLLTFAGTGAILYGDSSGGVGFTNSGTGTGLIGTGNGLTTAYSLTAGSGVSGTGEIFGIFGYSTDTGADPPNGGNYSSAGGYFASNYTNNFAVVAGWWDPPFGGNNNQNFKIIGNGSVSTIVKDVNNIDRIMYAPEAPETLFQDYGIGKLVNGSVVIQLDPILTKNIRVDNDHPLKVFIQLEGDCNGVYVTNKSKSSFTVKELKNGRSNVSFSWSIVATRADEVYNTRDGKTKVSHNNQRFPFAPKPLEVKEHKAIKNTGETINGQVVDSLHAKDKPNLNK